MRRFALLVTCLLVGFDVATGAAQRPAPVDVSLLLSRLADAVVAYYGRAQSILCDEAVSLQPVGSDLMSDLTPARRLLYELRVSWEPPVDGGQPEANVLRTLMRVNNRPPRDKDKDACMDPRAVSSDALAMFLPESQHDYVFTSAGSGKANGRPALMIDYRSREVGAITATRKDECFSISLPGRTRGRVWIDPVTADVLRLDERLSGIVDVTVPPDPKRHEQPEHMVIERLDSTITYRRVSFADPDESLVLPATKESVTVIRNAGTPRLRTSQTFRNYRRFMTGSRIVE